MKRLAILTAAAICLPMATRAQLITAGELTVDLRGADLSSSSTTWANQSLSLESVGNFHTQGGGNLNVASIGGYQGLFVNGSGANSVNSALHPSASMLGATLVLSRLGCMCLAALLPTTQSWHGA